MDLGAFVTQAAQKSRLALLFDGLDQISSGRPTRLAKLAFSIAGRCPVVLTSRPSAVLGIESEPKLVFLRLKPFSTQDQQRYFGDWYTQAEDVCALAPDVTRLPMLAYLVRELLQAGAIKTATTRTELYNKFIHHVLSRHELKVPLLDEAGLFHRVERALQALAFRALACAQPRIQKVPISEYGDEVHVPLKSLISFGLINRILERGEEALFFTHQSFQEFLAAQYASGKLEAIDQILAERWHRSWENVLALLAGLCGEPIIDKILTEPDNIIHSNLFLAARCTSEVTTLSTPCVTFLKAKLWELADIDPFRVDAIVQLMALSRFDISIQKRIVNWLRDEDLHVCLVAFGAIKSLGARTRLGGTARDH